MPKKLQEKEFFLPLSSGTNTEGDPRIPGSPTVITEDADFSVPGVVTERNRMIRWHSTNVADNGAQTTVEKPTMIGDHDGSVVVVGPDGIFESNRIQAGGILSSLYEQTSMNATIYSAAVDSEVVLQSNDNGTAFDTGYCRIWETVTVNFAISVMDRRAYLHSHASGTVQDSVRASVMSQTVGTSTIESGAKTVYVVDTDGTNDHVIYRYSNNSFAQTGDANIANNWSLDPLSFTSNTALVMVGISSSNVHITTVEDDGTEHAGVPDIIDRGTSNYFTHWGVNGSANDAAQGIVWLPISAEKRINSNADVTIVNTLRSAVVSAASTAVSTSYTLETTVSGARPGPCGGAYKYQGSAPHEAWFASTVYPTNSVPRLYVQGYNGTATNAIMYNLQLVGCPFYDEDTNAFYFISSHNGGKWWNSTATAFDNNSPQNSFIMFRITPDEDYIARPVCRFNEHSSRYDLMGTGTTYPYRRCLHVYRDQDYYGTNGQQLIFHWPKIPPDDTDAKGVETFRISTGIQKQSYVKDGDDMIFPGGIPYKYSSGTIFPMGSMEYPDGISVVNTNTVNGDFTNSGGAGTFNYCATYSFFDSDGNETESAPSPFVAVTFTNVNTNVNVSVVSPTLHNYGGTLFTNSLAINRPTINIYRSSADGNDLFRIASVEADTDAVDGLEVQVRDDGKTGFSTTNGLSKIYTARALYTLNGELENGPCFQHTVACIHKARYFYAPTSGGILYSKSDKPNLSREFNEVLSVPNAPRNIKSLASADDKLIIFTNTSVTYCYGEPLNDTGAGQGLSDPTPISQEHGVSNPRCTATVGRSVFFINEIDGLLYRLDGVNTPEYIGGAVRHYCEQYTYDLCWVNDRDSTVKFCSSTDGAPGLSFNYKYGVWGLLKGRYEDGVRFGSASSVLGRAGTNTVGDYIYTASTGAEFVSGGNGLVFDADTYPFSQVYLEDVTGSLNSTESIDIGVETSWIPLNDIAGYGKFYKWTLVGGKRDANCNVIARTAYAYEPYWSDNVEINTSTIAVSPLSDHFGAMTDNSVVDSSFKYEFDGSRHKTDAVKIRIETNNSTQSDKIELVGIRCRIGVKPGAYRLGSGRSTD